jgi:hypothetical protein
MRRIILFLTALLLALPAWAADTTFTATLKDIVGDVPNAFVRLRLKNCGTNIPRVSGTNIIAFSQKDSEGYYRDLFPNVSTGAISDTVVDQETITCGTVTGGGNFYYVIQIYTGDANSVTRRQKLFENSYNITGASFNLNSASPAGTIPVDLPSSAVLKNPTADQTVTQPGSTRLSVNRLSVTTNFRLPYTVSGDSENTWYGASACPTLPLSANLGANEHVFIQCKLSSTPLSWVEFMHSRVGADPENERVFAAYYHPALLLHNLSTSATRTSLLFSYGDVTTGGTRDWMLQADTANNGTRNLHLIGNSSDIPNAICRICLEPVLTLSGNLGVGTTVQTFLRGNTQVRGYVQSEAWNSNDTTGRAAFSLRKSDATETWLRNAGTRKLEIASNRDGGTTYFILDSDNLRFNFGPATSSNPMFKKNTDQVDVRKGDDSGYSRLDANAIALYRSAGSASSPDLWGDGTNALVIAGKADGSGAVKFGTTTQVSIGPGRAVTTSDEIPPTISTADQGYFFAPTVFIPHDIVANTAVGANNQVRVMQFVLPFRVTVTRISMEVTTAAASAVCDAGIYAADGNTRHVYAGANSGFSAGTTGVKTVTLGASVTLAPGAYYYAWTCSDATVQVRLLNNPGGQNSLLNAVTVEKNGTAANAASAGILPTTLGTITAATAAAMVAIFEP